MSSFLESGISDDSIPTKIYEASEKSALKPTKKKHITIVLVGGSGSGRTSFMSLLVNLALGVKPLELVDRHDPNSESAITLHRVNTRDGKIVRVLDTPDLGTRDDRSNIDHIRSALALIQVYAFDAVVVVADGDTTHLTDATVNAITSIFPRTIVDNIGFVFPNVAWNGCKFQMDSLPLELRKVKHWISRNPRAALDEYEKIKKEWPEEERRIRDARDQVIHHYKLAVDTLDGLVEWVDSRDRQLAEKIPQIFDLAEKVQKEIEAIVFNSENLRKVKGWIAKCESDIGVAEGEAKDIQKELEDIFNPTPRRQELERRLKQIGTGIGYLKKRCKRLRPYVGKFEDIIKAAQTGIRRFVDDFHTISYSQNFIPGANAAIKMLEGHKKELESNPDTKPEREFIDEIIEKLKDQLSNTNEL